jgi:hypothetical protein
MAVTGMGGKTLTPKQQKFAESYVECGNASKAYRLHYDTKNMKPATINKRASELLHDGEITGRIRELQSAHRQRHDVTVDGLTDELEEARFSAMVFGHISAAVAATMGKAKLHGLITDNLKVNGLEALKQLSNEQLIERIREIAAEITGYTAAAERKPRGA